MRVVLNGRAAETGCRTAFEFRENDEIIILNGFQIADDREIREGDQICVIAKGTMPNQDGLEAMMSARHTPGVHERLKLGRVAVAGLGGVGSHVAVILARMGVGELLLVDYDAVEPSNLNRQHYTIRHLSMQKTLAMKSQLADINPYINVILRDIKINADNAVSVFAGWPVVVEAFDDPVCKADLIGALLAAGGVDIIAASGLAGLGGANLIQTRHRLENLYLCGDLESAAGEGMGLMAPRVAICAGHQANMAIRLLMGMGDV